MLEANLALGRAGLVVLTFGNASAVDRAAGVVAIKPSGVSYDRARPLPTSPSSTSRPEQSSRARRDRPRTRPRTSPSTAPGATSGASCTRIRAFATAWAQARREIPCYGTTHADHFDGAVPVTRTLTPSEIQGEYEHATGEVIVETFAALELQPLTRPAVLVASHGPFAWGASVEEAVENAIALEVVATSAYHSVELAGELEPIPAELRAKHFLRKHGASAYYGQPA